jgi:hypothetical protein
MTNDFGVRRDRRPLFGVIIGVGVLAAIAGITFVHIKQKAAEGIADYRAWVASGPACAAAPKSSFDSPEGGQPQSSDFGGVRFTRVHGAVLCSDVNEEGGKGHDTFPVCQFDRPGLLEVSTPKGRFWFWPGYSSPATVAVEHGMPTCVVGATRDFGHVLVFDKPAG